MEALGEAVRDEAAVLGMGSTRGILTPLARPCPAPPQCGASRTVQAIKSGFVARVTRRVQTAG